MAISAPQHESTPIRGGKALLPTITPPSIGHLSLVDGPLTHLGQDSFKGEASLEVLDLSENNIDSVNVNAFRGLEVGAG